MKSQVKLNSKVIIPVILLTLLAGGIVGYYLYRSSSDYVFYREDTANRCEWKHGKITFSTLVAQNLKTIRISKNDVKSYLHEAESHGKCTRPVSSPPQGRPITDFVPTN